MENAPRFAKHTAIRTVATAAFFLVVAVILMQVGLRDIKDEAHARKDDIYFVWKDGKAIASGLNPYSRIHGSDMRTNDKYSTYFPGFFLLVSATVVAGVDEFEDFLPLWRVVQILCVLAIGGIIYRTLLSQGGILLALFGSAFWMCNRWTVAVMREGQIDIFAALFCIVAVLWLSRSEKSAALAYGASLAVKQIGIFLLPLFLLQVVRERGVAGSLRPLGRRIAYIALIPLLLSIPFLWWDSSGFIFSIFFSATRQGLDHFRAHSIDTLLGLKGIVARVPMLCLLGLVYGLYALRKVGICTAAFLLFAVFADFNSVLFRQYIVWSCAFLPLAVGEIVANTQSGLRRSDRTASAAISKAA